MSNIPRHMITIALRFDNRFIGPVYQPVSPLVSDLVPVPGFRNDQGLKNGKRSRFEPETADLSEAVRALQAYSQRKMTVAE
jgi:hypothetical protein